MEVDPEEVQLIIDAARTGAGTLDPREGAIEDPSIGGDALEDILTTTEETWANELTIQDQALVALADFLVAALDSFTEVDTSLAGAAGGE